MSRWYGMIGYGCPCETAPGVYTDRIIERPYYGDLINNTESNEQSESLNDDIQIRNDISIIADAYACQNFHLMKYVTFMGARWKIRSVKVAHPRLALSIGGVYNGPTPEPPERPGGSPGDQESVLPTPGISQDGLPLYPVQERSPKGQSCR